MGDHHPVKPEVLDGVPESPGGLFRDPVAGVGHLLQLGSPLGLGAPGGGLQAGVAIPVVHAHHGFQGDNDGLEIHGLVKGVIIHITDLTQLLFGLIQGLVDALGDDFTVVGDKEAQADAQTPAEACAAGAPALYLAGPGRT